MVAEFVSLKCGGRQPKAPRSVLELISVWRILRFNVCRAGSAETSLVLRLCRLFFSAVIFATFSMVVTLFTFEYSQGLEAQSQGFDAQEESPESARQLHLFPVPSNAILLYHNCIQGLPGYSANSYSYTSVFSSRNQSSCSDYEDGDYIFKVDVRLASLPATLSGDIKYDFVFDFYVVGDVPGASEVNIRVDGFTYYVNGLSFMFSASYCGTILESVSLSIAENDIKTALLCHIPTWTDVPSHFGGFPSKLDHLHILPPEFIEWPQPWMDVVSLEVTQGLQNWNNDLTLVRNRQTVVRAFVETRAGKERDFTATLEGRKLASDGSLIWKDTTFPVNPHKSIKAKSNVVARRGDINSSLNFKLPDNWTDLNENQSLQLELKFASDENVNCNNRCTETVSFTTIYSSETEINAPKIIVIPIPIESSNGELKNPRASVLIEQFGRIVSALPFPNIDFSILNYYDPNDPFDYETTLDEINDKIEKDIASEDKSAVYLGVLLGTNLQNGDQNAGLANIGYGSNSLVASWYTADINGGLAEIEKHLGYERNIGAHEFGHVLGLRHPGWLAPDSSKSAGPYDTVKRGMCGENQIELHPTIEFFKQYYGGSDFPRPSLGFLGDQNSEVWGVDTRYVGRYHRNSANYKFIYDTLSVINPNLIFSIMGYCYSIVEAPYNDGNGKFIDCENHDKRRQSQYAPECENNRGGQGRWIDAARHQYLIKCLKMDTCFSEAPDINVSRASEASTSINSDLITGSIFFSSEGTVTGAEFDTLFTRPRYPFASLAGEYALELRDDTGNAVRTIPFSTSQNSDGRISIKGNFSIIVPSLPDFDSFAVVKSGTELAVVRRSSNAPSVSISGITEGHQFKSGDLIDLSWTATDADGDDLTFKLYYSTDGGNNYRVLSRPTTNTRESYQVNSLEGSDTARIGISVSDGTRSSFSQTSVFSVAKHVPQVRIETPSSGAVFAEKQGFVLEASGYDLEDGSLPSSSFTWRSSLDGELGGGSFLVQSAADMSQGSHTITVTATDSDGMVSAASVDITIARRNMLPVANDDEVFGGLEETLRIDVLANDIDTEGDFDLTSLTIDKTPRLGIAEIMTTEMGMPVIEYSPITGGEDTFTYYICDALYRCDRAEVTVVFPDCTITGTRGSDNLVGTSVDDVICGLDGNDTIDGKGGNDLIYAGFGEDTVYGRTGDDTIYGGPGNDIILGHRGDDTIYGGLSNDKIWGGGGDDTIYGGEETDELYGEADNDILYGDNGPDTIHGGRGDDIVYGGAGGDTIRGNAGADTIYPGPGIDTVLGVSTDDTVLER